MAIRKPPCPPNCPNRRPVCQGSCNEYKEYRAILDEDKRVILEGKASGKNWTQAKNQAYMRIEKYKIKKAKGDVS